MINHNKNELHLQGIGQPMQSPTLFLLSWEVKILEDKKQWQFCVK
jgi:hypothetical protein